MLAPRALLVVSLLAAILAGALGASLASAASPSSYFTALPNGGLTGLQTPRFDAVAAPLPDGRVLIAGGDNDGLPLRSAELFDPVSDTFTALSEAGASELHVAREGAVSAPLPDGEVLIAGGYDEGEGGDLRSAELFDPATGTFTPLAEAGASELQSASYGAVASPLPDGKVLIAGGFDGNSYLQSAELFDPSTDTFKALSAAGATELQTARFDAVAASLPDGRVLIAGGQNTSLAVRGAELFDPATETFASLPEADASELNTAREGAATTALPDGQVLIVGGYDGSTLQSAELFDPVGEAFAALPEAGTTELQTARAGAIAAILPDGRVLIAGGYAGSSYLQSAELFYSAPQARAAGGDFGDQAIGEPSSASGLVVTNVGAQQLAIAGASLEGADSTDFAIVADACSGRRLAFGQSCTITVRFDPATNGPMTASVALLDNESSANAIALSGTGVVAGGPAGPTGPTGPSGATGATGATGPSGPTGLTGNTGPAGTAGVNGADGVSGAQGAAGPAGRAGAQGAPGQIDLVTCKPVTKGKGKHKQTIQQCTAKLTSSPVTFTTTATTAAVLSRAGVVYATGSAERSGLNARLLLTPRQPLGRGHYTLTLTRNGKRSRQAIAID